MFSQLRMREEQPLLAHDYALETARAEDLERGRAEGIEQGLKSRFSKSSSSRYSDFRACQSVIRYVSI
ncbi:Uncharacterised protein [uncultured Streptococcus sp.]|nr:Uncharacterised protein [uncultured Streptococcus sp.]